MKMPKSATRSFASSSVGPRRGIRQCLGRHQADRREAGILFLVASASASLARTRSAATMRSYPKMCACECVCFRRYPDRNWQREGRTGSLRGPQTPTVHRSPPLFPFSLLLSLSQLPFDKCMIGSGISTSTRTMHAHTDTHTRAHTDTHKRKHTDTHLTTSHKPHEHANIGSMPHAHTQASKKYYTDTYTHAHARTHARTNARTHTRTRTHTHTHYPPGTSTDLLVQTLSLGPAPAPVIAIQARFQSLTRSCPILQYLAASSVMYTWCSTVASAGI